MLCKKFVKMETAVNAKPHDSCIFIVFQKRLSFQKKRFFQDIYIEGVDDFSSGMAFLKQLYDLPRSEVAAVSRQRSCALYISHALRGAAPKRR